MPTVSEPSAATPLASTPSETVFLSRALAQGLDTPLSALRASLETLGHELRAGVKDIQPLRIEGVLGEFERLGRNVRELLDYATPPEVRPLACSLEEIVRAACAPLDVLARERVLVARVEPGSEITVDGPLLATALRRLIENALEAGTGQVLVVARREPAGTSFSVTDDASAALAPDWQATPFCTTKPNHLGLGLALTRRDVALLGGRLEFLRTPGGETCVRISLDSKETAR